MRIAIVTDIHGNLTALEAVVRDVRAASPDLILHGGDLAHGGANPAAVIDRVREFGWDGVIGNTDEMLYDRGPLREFGGQSPQVQALLPFVEEMASATAEALGDERMKWLQGLPRECRLETVALVHATPASLWRAPYPEANDEELLSAYSSLDRPLVVYGHVHRSYVRPMAGLTVVNTGSLSLSHDGDARASYLLINEGVPAIRRVAYDVEREVKALAASGFPHWQWTAKILATARPQMP